MSPFSYPHEPRFGRGRRQLEQLVLRSSYGLLHENCTKPSHLRFKYHPSHVESTDSHGDQLRLLQKKRDAATILASSSLRQRKQRDAKRQTILGKTGGNGNRT